MSKQSYTCSQCSYQTVKWLGCCPTCQQWDTFAEVMPALQAPSAGKKVSLKAYKDISTKAVDRYISGIKEWDRVTGGGIVPGSFSIITGDPGIGKSTLLLQIAQQLSQSYSVIYFSTEESLQQVKLRAERLNCHSSNLLFADQANLEDIISTAEHHKPHLLIIDSIQNCYMQSQMMPGSINQLREAAFKLMRLAKSYTIAIIVTGHITKEGVIAGPKTLEHMVDAVFYLQGEDKWQARILRSIKNRFGTIAELGFFQMEEQGLQEIPHFNQHLLEDVFQSPGSVLISFIEGTRPLILELQALVLVSKYGMPQRVVSGIDQTQVVIIAAILEKYLQVKISAHDIFFKVSGGFKIKSSNTDLGIALALLSSYFQKELPERTLALGEISLTGHIKPINQLAAHTADVEKFGIKQLILAKNQTSTSSCKKIYVNTVHDLLDLFSE